MSRPPWARALALVSFELSLWAVAAALSRLTGTRLGVLDGLAHGWMAAIATAIAAFAAFRLLDRFEWRWMNRVRAFLDETARPLFEGMSPLWLALVALAAGIGEESLFRGWLQPWLETKLPPAAAWAVAAIAFGAAHPITPGYVVLASLLGAVLGALRLQTGGWAAPALVHCLYDAFALWWLFSDDSRRRNETRKKN